MTSSHCTRHLYCLRRFTNSPFTNRGSFAISARQKLFQNLRFDYEQHPFCNAPFHYPMKCEHDLLSNCSALLIQHHCFYQRPFCSCSTTLFSPTTFCPCLTRFKSTMLDSEEEEAECLHPWVKADQAGRPLPPKSLSVLVG